MSNPIAMAVVMVIQARIVPALGPERCGRCIAPGMIVVDLLSPVAIAMPGSDLHNSDNSWLKGSHVIRCLGSIAIGFRSR
jgi:hypothetical protein